MSSILDLRKQNVNKITYVDTTGKSGEFKTASLRLPWIISKLWTNKLIGEKPYVFYTSDKEVTKKERERVPYDIETDYLIQELLESGKVCFIPKNSGDKFYIEMIPNYTYVENEDGRLLYFEYTKQNINVLKDGIPVKVSIKTKYFIDQNNKAFVQESYTGDWTITFEPVYLGEELPPMIIGLKNDKPIWFNAAELIKDANNVYTEMLYDMDLSRKLLALPDRFINKTNPRDKLMTSISDTHRAVRTMPMGSDKDDKAGSPQWFEGKFNPEPFLDALNFQLHLISLNCYFGSRYLSYDKVSNQITATEINSADNDLYINRLSLIPYVDEIYKHIVKTFDMLSDKPIREVQLEHNDSIFDSQDKLNTQLSLDAGNGLISNRQYLIERYDLDSDEIEEWLPEPSIYNE